MHWPFVHSTGSDQLQMTCATWPLEVVESWDALHRIASAFRFGSPFTTATVARGQADATWNVCSSLERLLPADVSVEAALEVEQHLLRDFKATARQFLPTPLIPDEESVVEWWCLMQHHGCPTRLTDWTASLYVAAYFAVATHWDRDGAIWCMHPQTLIAHTSASVGYDTPLDPIAVSPDAPKLITMAVTLRCTDRMHAQQSHFSYPLNILTNQHNAIVAALPQAVDGLAIPKLCKLIIPKELKPVFLDQLLAMNVTASALFPGVDGLGRRLYELARVAFSVL